MPHRRDLDAPRRAEGSGGGGGGGGGDGDGDGALDVTSRLTVALDAMAPVGVEVGVRSITRADEPTLEPSEHAVVERAVDRRRFEFASGRVLLRELLGETLPILRGPTGAAALPVGVRGSLAHDRDHVIAAITRRADIASIGIDIEPARSGGLSDGEVRLILRHDDTAPDPLAAFVMKEATYKAWSQLGGVMLDHHDVHVRALGDTFEATVLRSDADGDTRFSGRLELVARRWLALVVHPT